jgi:hypothetical protein
MQAKSLFSGYQAGSLPAGTTGLAAMQLAESDPYLDLCHVA